MNGGERRSAWTLFSSNAARWRTTSNPLDSKLKKSPKDHHTLSSNSTVTVSTSWLENPRRTRTHNPDAKRIICRRHRIFSGGSARRIFATMPQVSIVHHWRLELPCLTPGGFNNAKDYAVC